MDIREQIAGLEARKRVFWDTAQTFLDNRDAHGIHDMGVEIQALDRAITELKKLDGGVCVTAGLHWSTPTLAVY